MVKPPTSTPAEKLPVLSLPYPHILLPANRLSLPVPVEIGDALLALVEEYESKNEENGQEMRKSVPVVVAVPVVPSSPGGQDQPTDAGSPSQLAEWGTTARVVRLVKPPSSQSQAVGRPSPLTVSTKRRRQPYLVSLQGLARVRLVAPSDSHQSSSPIGSSLPLYAVDHVTPSGRDSSSLSEDSSETVAKFKQAALSLLDRLARDSVQQAKKDGYIRIAEMLDDLDVHSPHSLSRAVWVADVLVGSVITDYNDKLASLSTPSPAPLLTLATQTFIKHTSILDVSKKIASAVDESLSRAQKEFFLKQQLEAIQRELYNIQRQNSNSSSNSTPSSGIDGFGFNSPNGPSPSPQNDLDSESDDLNSDPSEEFSLVSLKRKIEALSPGSEERKMGAREWKRLKRIPMGSVENGVVRSYLEWLISIPWPSYTVALPPQTPADSKPPHLTLSHARAQLDADHFGLDKVKKRLIEYLAVVRIREANGESLNEGRVEAKSTPGQKAEKEVVTHDKQQDTQQRQQQTSPISRQKKPIKGPILLFVGPPGTGKTSLGQSIARTLGRPFQRIALGGVRDEAEIRGHRRTYVASGPGLIVQALRKMGRLDGVLLLDEVDKIGQSNFHGDPSAALLEALDPEQNHSFNDHYINVPIDLSQILFICTANTLETISAPFLDRCEVIQLSGYTHDEKLHIARRFLLPKQLEANGLGSSHVQITDGPMKEIVNRYTRGEAGVRGLERKIGSVVRAKLVEWTESIETHQLDMKYNPVVETHDLEKILGIAPWDASGEGGDSERGREERKGVVYGLVVMSQGEGGILPVETVMVPGAGKMKSTGMLGDVIKESAELALSWVKTNSYDLGITSMRSDDPLKVPRLVDVHLHLPAGAQRKDGPSAGIAMICALVSLLTSLIVPSTTALTGEITLRGTLAPVGGIKEKVLGAHRAGMRKVILPWANRREVEMDVPQEVRREVRCVFARNVREAVEEAFGRGVVRWKRQSGSSGGGGGGGEGSGEVVGREIGGVVVESRL